MINLYTEIETRISEAQENLNYIRREREDYKKDRFMYYLGQKSALTQLKNEILAHETDVIFN